MADLDQKETARMVTKIFVKLKFHDFTRQWSVPDAQLPLL
jgi:hypothetical protein